MSECGMKSFLFRFHFVAFVLTSYIVSSDFPHHAAVTCGLASSMQDFSGFGESGRPFHTNLSPNSQSTT